MYDSVFVDRLTHIHTRTHMHGCTRSSDSMKVKCITNRSAASMGQIQPCVFLLEKHKTKVEESWVQLLKTLMGFF